MGWVRWGGVGGEAPFSRGYPDAEGQIKRLLEILKNLLPVEKKLHTALGSKVWCAGDPLKSGADPAAADADARAAARADVSKAIGKRDAADIPGVDLAFPLAEYDGDLESWAASVETILTEEHRADCKRVRDKVEAPGCPSCRGGSCSKCWWPKTVRYWRRLETAGRFADVEGYDARLVKTPTALEIS